MNVVSNASSTSYTSTVLSNDLRVHHAHIPGAATFAAALAFDLGHGESRRIPADIAHLVEHLSIEGLGPDYIAELGRRGLQFNGMTTERRVAFVVSGHRRLQRLGLEFLERATGPLVVPQDLLRRELRVLDHERAGAISPASDAWNSLVATLTQTRVVCWDHRRLRRAAEQRAEEWRELTLQPAHATLYCAGPESGAMYEPFATRSGAGGGRIEEYSEGKASPDSRLRVVWNLGSAMTHVVVVIAAREGSRATRKAMELLSDAVGDGPFGGLYRDIRQGQGMAYDVGSGLDAGIPGFLILSLGVFVRGRDACGVVVRIEKLIEQMKCSGLDSREMAAARERTLDMMDVLEQSPTDLVGAMMAIPTSPGAHWTPNVERAVVEAMDVGELNSELSRILDPKRRGWAIVGSVGPIRAARLRALSLRYLEGG